MPSQPDVSHLPQVLTLNPSAWMRQILLAAAVYNIVWGAFAILSPLTLSRWCGFDPLPLNPELWQFIGMIVGVYGVGYGIAARDPFRHWPIVLVGLPGKIFGPIGLVSTNWIRTAAWSVRGVIVMMIIYRSLGAWSAPL